MSRLLVPRSLRTLLEAAPRREPNRFEYKYWVDARGAAAVRHAARTFLIPDGAERLQELTSLYLDGPTRRCFWAHVDGERDRFKLRVRAYGQGVPEVAFLEVKRKVNHVTVKTRARVPAALVTPLLGGDWRGLEALEPSARRHAEHFLALQASQGLEPVMLLRYRREAYRSAEALEDVRLTLDDEVRAAPSLGSRLDVGARPFEPVLPPGVPTGAVLVELKFPRVAPGWMAALVQRLELGRVANSKYVTALRQLEQSTLTLREAFEAQEVR